MANRRTYAARQQISLARELRNETTTPERLLWGRLRGGRLAGMKFRRQHPVGPFVADFYCHDHKLVIELDGDSHEGRAEYDARRTEYLKAQGVRVVRFGNDDVIQDMDAVLTAILLTCGIDPDAPSP